MATRLSTTGHSNRFSQNFVDYGLAADIPFTYINVGLKQSHPVLSLVDILDCLDRSGKLDVIMQGNKERDFEQFWSKYRMVQPHHPIFLTHAGREQFCVPIAVHCDEGTTLKKKSIMIIQLHSIMGKGTKKRKSTDAEPGINMLGNTLVNRVLWSVMLARVYSGKKNGNKPLEKLIENLASQLSEAFYKGCRLQRADKTIYLVPICMKGDWPALAKIGSLSRHFGRAMKTGQSGGQGICHLCKADKPSFENWHDVSWGNMCRMHANCPLPWSKEPALVRAVGIPREYQPDFFRFDIFHALHKGLMADIGANTIVLWPK